MIINSTHKDRILISKLIHFFSCILKPFFSPQILPLGFLYKKNLNSHPENNDAEWQVGKCHSDHWLLPGHLIAVVVRVGQAVQQSHVTVQQRQGTSKTCPLTSTQHFTTKSSPVDLFAKVEIPAKILLFLTKQWVSCKTGPVHEILRLVCLQQPTRQCSDVTKLDCTHWYCWQ